MTDKRKLEEENSKKPGKTPAKPAAKPEKKTPAKKRTMKAVPILWEAAFSGSMAVIVILGAVVSLLSFLVGCDPWTVLLRGLVTILALGIILWLMTWLVIRGSMDNLLEEMEELSKKQQEESSTTEVTV
jgi:NADH:ubiquinone oxidoreductase subunit 6 (subunit J)